MREDHSVGAVRQSIQVVGPGLTFRGNCGVNGWQEEQVQALIGALLPQARTGHPHTFS